LFDSFRFEFDDVMLEVRCDTGVWNWPFSEMSHQHLMGSNMPLALMQPLMHESGKELEVLSGTGSKILVESV